MPLRDNPTKELETISIEKGYMFEYKQICLAVTSEIMKLRIATLGKHKKNKWEILKHEMVREDI